MSSTPEYTPDASQTKYCRTCGRTIPIERFPRNSKRPDGHHSQCKDCARAYYDAHKSEIAAYKREWGEANKDRIRAQRRGFYDANLEKILEYQRDYRAKNGEAISDRRKRHRIENHDMMIARGREYYHANRDMLVKKNSEYYRTHKERSREYGRKYKKTEKGKAFRKASEHRRRARELNSIGQWTSSDLEMIRKAQTDKRGRVRCWYCGKAMSEWHIEHKTPLARGGSNGPENLCLACPTCNFSKGAKTIQDLGRLI